MNFPKSRVDTPLDGVKTKQTTASGVELTGSRGEFAAVNVLENDLVRVRVYPQGSPRLDRTWLILDQNGDMPREGRDRDDLSPFSKPAFSAQTTEDQITLTTSDLQVIVNLKNFGITWATKNDLVLASDGANAYRFENGGQQISHVIENQDGEHYYGFGEVSGAINKAGKKIYFRNKDNPGYSAKNGTPLYKHIPYYITFQPATGQAFGIFYDNLATTLFDLDHPAGSRSYQAEGGDIDYYFIYGPTIADVVVKFTRLTGKMILPPRWSLGYLGSTMNYTEARDAQVQLAKFSEECKQYRIPCDLFHLSSGYTLGEDGKRYVFTWNRNRVPDPKEMVESFHRNGIRLSANIKPALLTTHVRFNEVKDLKAFIRTPDGQNEQRFEFWGGTAAALDFTNPTAVDWWKKNAQEQLLDYGIDSTWNDNNEFEVAADDAQCLGFGKPLPIGLARPLQTLFMMRASYEQQLTNRPNERPFLISRAGAPGMQRYVQTWSGDNFTSWQTLKYNLAMGLSLSLSGVSNTGHDVGGFAGFKPSPELFLRWVQNSVFHPRFTIHSWKPRGGANEPWMYASVFPQVQEAIYFRYRLIPYLYNLEVEAARTGSPILRPLVYQFPEDPNCLDESFDYMVGPWLLAASVTAPFTRRRKVYLPAGQGWYDFYTLKHYDGGQTVTVPAPMDYVPLFAEDGAMIPMGEVVHPLIHAKDDLRQVVVFPAKGEGHSTLDLTEDDGTSLNYQRGEVTGVKIDLTSSAESIELSVTLDPYNYAVQYSELEFVLPAGETRKVTLAGGVETAADEKGRRHFTWKLPEFKGRK
jgi:alpha-glucosidase